MGADITNLMEGAATGEKPVRGVITRLFGVVLIFVGALDSMLSWRGGLEVSDFYLVLLAAGIFLLVIGVIRGGAQT